MNGKWTLFAALLAGGFALGLGLRACGAGAPAPRKETAAPPERGLVVDLGNHICPVMGGEVDGVHHIDWDGLRVGFCCGGCDQRFLADPEKALATTNSDWRAARAAIEAWRTAPPEGKARALDAIRARWKVLHVPGKE